MGEKITTFDVRPVGGHEFEAVLAMRMVAYSEVRARLGNWGEAEERAHFERRWTVLGTSWILVGGARVGVLEMDVGDITFVRSLVIVPEMQRRGLGTLVMREVLAAAARRGQDVALEVLTVNPEARRLYERLGFVEESGTAERARMVWRARGCA